MGLDGNSDFHRSILKILSVWILRYLNESGIAAVVREHPNYFACDLKSINKPSKHAKRHIFIHLVVAITRDSFGFSWDKMRYLACNRLIFHHFQ